MSASSALFLPLPMELHGRHEPHTLSLSLSLSMYIASSYAAGIRSLLSRSIRRRAIPCFTVGLHKGGGGMQLCCRCRVSVLLMQQWAPGKFPSSVLSPSIPLPWPVRRN